MEHPTTAKSKNTNYGEVTKQQLNFLNHVFFEEVKRMRTSLEYSVLREEEYDYQKDKMVNRIKSRGFAFCVTGCKTKEEHEKTIDSFYEFLSENNVESFGFGGGTWEDALRLDDEKNFSYLDIPVKDTEDKEYIKDLYKEWKRKIR